MKRLLFSLIAALSCFAAHAQNYNLSKFTNASGLPQNYAYSIIQAPNGYIWIGLAEGLSRYDGIRFQNYSVRDSLADNYVSKLLVDTDERLWCGHGNGQFTVLDGGRFRKVFVPDVAAPIRDMCLDDRGNIWAVEQNKGLIRIDPDKNVTTYFDRELFGRRIYYSVRAINSVSLLVGTSDGLMLVKFDVDGSLREPLDIEDIPYSAVNCIANSRDMKSFWIGMEEGDIYRYCPGKETIKLERFSEVCTPTTLENLNIRTIYEAEDGNLYIGTWGDGLKEWKQRGYGNEYIESLSLNENNGLGNNFVSDILLDREGIFWFATYGGGVVAWINNFFAEYNLSDIGFHRNKVLAAQVYEGILWLTLNNGLIKMDTRCMDNYEYFDSSMGLPTSALTCVVFDSKRGVQYIGSENAGVFYRRLDEPTFQQLDYGAVANTSNMINNMAIDDSTLYLATQGGFVTHHIESKKSRIYTTNDRLPHNNINFVHVDPDGQVWLGPKDSGILLFYNEQFEQERLSEQATNIVGITCEPNGTMWLATSNAGIIQKTLEAITPITDTDLEKNYCYGISNDTDGRIWVCHQPGLSCVDNVTRNTRRFNSTNGVGQEFTGVTRDDEGDLWFSSSSGVLRYLSHNDRRGTVAPIINLTKVTVKSESYPIDEPIDLPYPYDGDFPKIGFDFIGICMKNPMNVRYDYWMETVGKDKDERWSTIGTQSHKEFDFLRESDYIFHVRAVNSDGVYSEPISIFVHVDPPFWKTLWFPIVMLVIIIIVGRIITKLREKKLRERQKELESEVLRQTALLSKQKGEIERKNKDIMDSINYAKYIQTSILPSRTGLKDFGLRNSFILFMPRDLVSGDFYWFNRFGDHVVICCGDCTGHGVPGAFMSMIGTMILNEATINTIEVLSPARILEKLDKEIKRTLNKNKAAETQDGMDCAIIDINLETLEVKSAAARRPIYFFQDGKLNEVRGTRRSIGDHRNGNEFVETVIHMQKNDSLYVSSDGFTDQFGEETGEKYTTGSFKRFLSSIVGEPSDMQAKMLESEFRRWKGKREQIDDVIVMGIKF